MNNLKLFIFCLFSALISSCSDSETAERGSLQKAEGGREGERLGAKWSLEHHDHREQAYSPEQRSHGGKGERVGVAEGDLHHHPVVAPDDREYG